MTESEFRRGPAETVTTRVDPATDYRNRLELVEDAVAAVLGRAAAAPTAREERERCLLVAERILTKANALVGRLASPSAAAAPPGTFAEFAAEVGRILDGAKAREQGEGP